MEILMSLMMLDKSDETAECGDSLYAAQTKESYNAFTQKLQEVNDKLLHIVS